MRMANECEFGKLMGDKFNLDPEGLFLNHGSYGATPKIVQSERFRLLEEQEAQPDLWCRVKHPALWERNVEAAAKFIGANPKNLVFVSNATTGINTVLRSLAFKPGDAILTQSYTYKAVRNACLHTARKSGAEVLTLDVRPPILNEDEIVTKYDNYLADHPNVKLVVLDYISSVAPVKFPVSKLVPVFRKHDVLILVDGAHTPGQLELNLEELGVDFYTGNLHKWLFVPRSCAVLWISPQFHDVIRPVVTSAHLNHELIKYNFIWQGTVDYSAYFCTEKAIEFIRSMGGQGAYIKYCSELADKAADLLVQRFGTEQFAIPKEMEAPFMRLIKLPKLSKYQANLEVEGDVGTIYGDLQKNELLIDIWSKFQLQSLFLSVHSEPWVRISCSVYNSIEDYEKLADCILQIKHENE